MQINFHPLQIQYTPNLFSLSSNQYLHIKSNSKTRNFRYLCSSSSSSKLVEDDKLVTRSEYKPNWLDGFFLNLFRKKLVEVQILKSLFPPYLLELYRMLITPVGGGRIAAMMVARVTTLTCQWLMGPCSINTIELRDGSSCQSGVLVERCKYLEESKCVGICVNTCKLPTQTFFKDHMGIPLLMEPNFTDYSCQFKFGVLPPEPENDSAFQEPCLDGCPYAAPARGGMKGVNRISSKPKPCPRS